MKNRIHEADTVPAKTLGPQDTRRLDPVKRDVAMWEATIEEHTRVRRQAAREYHAQLAEKYDRAAERLGNTGPVSGRYPAGNRVLEALSDEAAKSTKTSQFPNWDEEKERLYNETLRAQKSVGARTRVWRWIWGSL
jgi:hypothetical protein